MLAFATAATVGADAQSADDWELKISDDVAGIKVFYQTNSRGYVEFRGVTQVRSSLGAFVALFRDVENMPTWVYRTKKVTTLKTVSDTEVYAYTVSEMPWPLDDRDSIVRTTLSQDAKTLAITIRGSAVPDYIPVARGYVRMPVVESFWRFTPLNKGVVEVEFQGYGDPGGNLSSAVPKWITRLTLYEAPQQTLLGLQKVIARLDYQSQTFEFVREPGK